MRLSVLCLASALALAPLPALAQTATFTSQNPFSADIRVYDVTVTQTTLMYTPRQNCGPNESCLAVILEPYPAAAAILSARLQFPTCGSGSYLAGEITFRYTNGDAHFTRKHEIRKDEEGKYRTPQWTVWGYYGDPNEGSMNVSARTYCQSHYDDPWEIPWPFW